MRKGGEREERRRGRRKMSETCRKGRGERWKEEGGMRREGEGGKEGERQLNKEGKEYGRGWDAEGDRGEEEGNLYWNGQLVCTPASSRLFRRISVQGVIRRKILE